MMSSFWMAVFAFFTLSQPLRITVNIPAYRLDVYLGDSLTRSISIAPGMPSYRTPRGDYEITSVEWNPWWIPPSSPWASKERPTPPSSANPMGRVKLNFRPMYFLHGTPLEESIGTAASHGCVRMRESDAIGLAKVVLQYGVPGLSADTIARLARDTVETRLIPLVDPVPLELRYDLVELRRGRVYVYPDVYHLAERSLAAEVYAALDEYGVDSTGIDSARVSALVAHLPRQGRSVVLDSLVTQPPAGPRRQERQTARSRHAESDRCVRTGA